MSADVLVFVCVVYAANCSGLIWTWHRAIVFIEMLTVSIFIIDILCSHGICQNQMLLTVTVSNFHFRNMTQVDMMIVTYLLCSAISVHLGIVLVSVSQLCHIRHCFSNYFTFTQLLVSLLSTDDFCHLVFLLRCHRVLCVLMTKSCLTKFQWWDTYNQP